MCCSANKIGGSGKLPTWGVSFVMKDVWMSGLDPLGNLAVRGRERLQMVARGVAML